MAANARFAGRTCVVSGGSYGIGQAVAERFLSEGGRVIICSRSQENVDKACSQLSEISPEICGHAVDVADRAAVTAFAASVSRSHGGVDVLVNNAFSQIGGTVADSSDEQWLGNFAATLHGTFYMTRALLPIMRGRGNAAIINISSVTGSLVLPGTAGYGAAKAGLEQLTRVIAVEEAPNGIRCNVVVAGGVATPALDKLVHGNYDLVSGNVPLKRVAQPREIAAVVSFLASDDASYVTAATVTADGGLSACMNQNVDQSDYQS